MQTSTKFNHVDLSRPALAFQAIRKCYYVTMSCQVVLGTICKMASVVILPSTDLEDLDVQHICAVQNYQCLNIRNYYDYQDRNKRTVIAAIFEAQVDMNVHRFIFLCMAQLAQVHCCAAVRVPRFAFTASIKSIKQALDQNSILTVLSFSPKGYTIGLVVHVDIKSCSVRSL